eukprot:CAMPEP_0174822930 /NCGR_PEP_ID=MMETSP1107-20130205/19929_1 /TAXON_ID=36770 /ORGANISM="Paraphysomonas vestita, Strain GFlagA" /LENGTH=312 /DNA_ID=CAMNT_0016043477 /DNA_START=107 /DNA_END=1041 /DNA_ORIENTATION=-
MKAWRKYAPINNAIVYPLRPIPEIQAVDYSIENLIQASEGFTRPVVIRGLYNNSRGVKYWNSRNYLPDAFGDDIVIPVVKDATLGTLQDEREIESFRTSFNRVYDSEYSKEYLFFPAKSRYSFKGVTPEDAIRLEKRGNEIIKRDFDLNLIRPNLGNDKNTNFMTGQYVIGKSPETDNPLTVGTDFHCAGANNWFIQVVGKKRWEFLSPKYSAYLWPLKGGLVNFWNSNENMARDSVHLPREFVDLYPGDVLLNPPWQWHKIVNYPGFTIGVPIRELNGPNTLTNNLPFGLLISTNIFLDKFGLSLGGFPPP